MSAPAAPIAGVIEQLGTIVALDWAGHVSCTYDNTGNCECSTMPKRLAAFIEQVRVEALAPVQAVYDRIIETSLGPNGDEFIALVNSGRNEVLSALRAVIADPDAVAEHNAAIKAKALNDAADAIQELHPGEVKASVTFLQDRARAMEPTP